MIFTDFKFIIVTPYHHELSQHRKRVIPLEMRFIPFIRAGRNVCLPSRLHTSSIQVDVGSWRSREWSGGCARHHNSA